MKSKCKTLKVRKSIMAMVVGLGLIIATGSVNAYEIWIANQSGSTGTQVLPSDLSSITTIPAFLNNGNVGRCHIGDFDSTFDTYYCAYVGVGSDPGTAVGVIDANTKTLTTVVDTNGRTHALMVSENDNYVAINNLNDRLQILDTATNTITQSIDIGDGPGGVIDKPVCLSMTADSKKIYQATAVSGKVIIVTVDNTTGAETAPQTSIPGIANACGQIRSKDNQSMYVNGGKPYDTFNVIDLATDTVIFTGAAGGLDSHAIAETNNGKEIWSVNRDSTSIDIRDGTTYALLTTVDVAAQISGVSTGDKIDLIGFSPNSKELIGVIRSPASLVFKMDTKTRTVTATKVVGGDPHGLRIRH